MDTLQPWCRATGGNPVGAAIFLPPCWPVRKSARSEWRPGLCHSRGGMAGAESAARALDQRYLTQKVAATTQQSKKGLNFRGLAVFASAYMPMLIYGMRLSELSGLGTCC